MKMTKLFWLIFSASVYIAIFNLIVGEEFIVLLNSIPIDNLYFSLFFIIIAMVFSFFRWHYLLGRLEIKIDYYKSLGIFLSGEFLGFMPAKSGELLSQLLLKEQGIAFTRTVPIFFITNIINLLVLLAFSAPFLFLDEKIIILFSSFFVLIVPIFLIKHTKTTQIILDVFHRKSKIKTFNDIQKSINQSKILFSNKSVLVTTALTVLRYASIGFAFFMIAKNFSISIPVHVAYSIYSLSLIFGFLSLIPGGVGVLEATSIYLLINYMVFSEALVLILTMRLMTLWLPMFIGLIAFFITTYKYKIKCKLF